MATPQFQVLNTGFTIYPGSPGSVRFLTKTPAGAAIDVSSGFTVGNLWVRPQGNYNSDNASTDVKAQMTATFDTTGVTLSWTGAQAATIAGDLQMLGNNYSLQLSNDSGSTLSLLSGGQFTVNLLNATL